MVKIEQVLVVAFAARFRRSDRPIFKLGGNFDQNAIRDVAIDPLGRMALQFFSRWIAGGGIFEV